MKKIIFVEPRCGVSSQGTELPWIKTLPILGPLLLGTILEKEGYDVEVYKETIKEPNYNQLESDYLCLYSMTNTYPRAVEVAYEYKKNNPDGKVLMGGPHVTFTVPEVSKLKYNGKPLVDHIVTGEAENVILDIIKGEKKERVIKGSRVNNLDALPRINFSLLKGLPKKNYCFAFSMSRGCPYNCKFCCVTKFLGTQMRFRSIDLVIKDIIDSIENYNFKIMFFYDDNFFAIPSKTKELLKELIKNDINKGMFVQARVDVARDDEILKLLNKIGNVQLYIGFESVNDETLKDYNKRLKLEEIKKYVKKIHDYGIAMSGSFVIGSDYDDKNIFQNTIDFCNSVEIDTPACTILTPVPGTDLYKELDKQNRIFNKDWNYYDFNHVVFKPKRMSAYELQQGYMDIYKNLYSITSKRTLKKIINGIISLRWIFNIKSGIAMRGMLKKLMNEKLEYLDYLKRLEK